jgi:hypothetical protein
MEQCYECSAAVDKLPEFPGEQANFILVEIL